MSQPLCIQHTTSDMVVCTKFFMWVCQKFSEPQNGGMQATIIKIKLSYHRNRRWGLIFPWEHLSQGQLSKRRYPALERFSVSGAGSEERSSQWDTEREIKDKGLKHLLLYPKLKNMLWLYKNFKSLCSVLCSSIKHVLPAGLEVIDGLSFGYLIFLSRVRQVS